MTDQEIDKLREKLGSEYSVKRLNGAITVELVDIWDGVEFAECVTGVKADRYGKEIIKGNIYPIDEWFKREVIYIDKDELGWQSKHFKPSTESAYVEQLKAKAHELYGDIKDGDRFEMPWIGNDHKISLKDEYDFYYDKKTDLLDLHGFPLYRQGIWAKKVERVNVEGEWVECNNDHLTVRFKFNYKGSHPNPEELSTRLAKFLEYYINKIQ